MTTSTALPAITPVPAYDWMPPSRLYRRWHEWTEENEEAAGASEGEYSNVIGMSAMHAIAENDPRMLENLRCKIWIRRERAIDDEAALERFQKSDRHDQAVKALLAVLMPEPANGSRVIDLLKLRDAIQAIPSAPIIFDFDATAYNAELRRCKSLVSESPTI